MERRQLHVFAVRPLQFPDHDSPPVVFTTTRSPRRPACPATTTMMVAVAVRPASAHRRKFHARKAVVPRGGQRHPDPAFAGGIAVFVEIGRRPPPAPRLSSGTKWPPRAPSPINCMNVSIELPLAASVLPADSVEGQPLAASA